MAGSTPSGLFTTPAPNRRSWAAVPVSAALHALLFVAVFAMARIAPSPAAPRDRRPLTFVMMVPLPVPHEPTPALTLPPAPAIERTDAEPPVPVEVVKPETPPPAPKPLARAEPGPAPPEPVRPAPPAVAPPAAPVVRTPPPVTVGLFADAAPTVHEAEPVKKVRDAGFDAPATVAKAGDTKTAAVTGAFDSAPAAPARTARSGAAVAVAGFGSAQTDGAPQKQIAEVRPSGFDAVRPAPPATPRPMPPAERVDIPVEILFKPAPIYTEEARRLKLEGDVLLDVEFQATGAVTVLQVVRGLGHGLDEAATAAARQIRFKPAQSAGRAVSFRTTVHIVFRLA